MKTRTITEIIGELAQLSKKSGKDSKHFNDLAWYMRQQNYPAVRRLIVANKGSWIFATAYQSKLEELNSLIAPLAPEESEKLLYELIDAVYNKDADEIELMLELGSVRVINQAATNDSEIHDVDQGETPLMAALVTEDVETIALLLKYWATLDNVDDVNLPLNDEGETALHIACRLNLPDVVVMLLEKGADVNVRRADGATPLYLACAYHADKELPELEQENMLANIRNIATWLMNRKTDLTIGRPTKKAYLRDTPFVAALHNERIAKDMIDSGYVPDRIECEYAKQYNRNVYDMLRAPVRMRKKQIVQTGSLSATVKLDGLAGTDQIQTLLDRIYVEDPDLRDWLAKQIIDIYNNGNAILKPLLTLTARAAAGSLPAKGKATKPLKVMVVNDTTVNPLAPYCASAQGVYKGKNTVYVASGWGNKEMVLAALLHELKHYADLHVYGDTAKPYKDNQAQHFRAIKARLREKYKKVDDVQSVKPESVSIFHERFIAASINTVFTAYKKKNQDAEIMVKVPEIIGLLGVDQGYAWLEQNEKAMLMFYKVRFNHSCERFLECAKQPYQPEQDSPPPSFKG